MHAGHNAPYACRSTETVVTCEIQIRDRISLEEYQWPQNCSLDSTRIDTSLTRIDSSRLLGLIGNIRGCLGCLSPSAPLKPSGSSSSSSSSSYPMDHINAASFSFSDYSERKIAPETTPLPPASCLIPSTSRHHDRPAFLRYHRRSRARLEL